MLNLPLFRKKLLLPSHAVKNVLINTPPRRMLHLAFHRGHSWRRVCKKKDVTHAVKADCQTRRFMQTRWLWCLISEPKPQSCKVEATPHACIFILECTLPTVQHWNYTSNPSYEKKKTYLPLLTFQTMQTLNINTIYGQIIPAHMSCATLF